MARLMIVVDSIPSKEKLSERWQDTDGMGEVVAEASNGREVVERYPNSAPDLAHNPVRCLKWKA